MVHAVILVPWQMEGKIVVSSSPVWENYLASEKCGNRRKGVGVIKYKDHLLSKTKQQNCNIKVKCQE